MGERQVGNDAWWTGALWGLCLVFCTGTARADALPPPAAPARYDVDVREAWIPMPDGVKLAATLYVPRAHRRGERFAAVLEYLPYRKDEQHTHTPVHEYFARRGFVSAQVDIRGTGRSEGQLIPREYSETEQRDGEAVIAWLASQPWANGSVGMFGISWGGFNSLQMAMRNPPALKAIIAIDATDALFREDVHFIDGMMHVDEYEMNVDMLMSMSRAPDFPTDEKSLRERFDATPWILGYKAEPRNGAFWDAPVKGLERIRIPVYLIGGMLDGYRDAVPRMVEHLKSPVRALLGPWNHSEPHDAVPGPASEWRDLAVEWWGQWLRGEHTVAMQRPALSVYVNHAYPPDASLTEIPGEWRAEAGWPPAGARTETFYLGARHELSRVPGFAARHQLAYRPAAIQEAGGPDFWFGDLWGDQRSVDAYSLQYDSEPLTDALTLLGRPRVCITVSASAPTAHWFARLSDVAPDGTSTLVAGAGLAGAQRDSDRAPTPLEPGRDYPLCIDLHLNSWVFPPGHRLHVAVSNALWPMIWPTPYPMTTTLAVGEATRSRLELPVVPDRGAFPPPVFAPPEGAADAPREASLNVSSNVPGLKWTVSRDPAAGTAEVEWRGGSSSDFAWGHEDVTEKMVFTADDRHPERSAVHGEAETLVTLPGRVLRWRGILDVTSDLEQFHVRYRRELYENGALTRARDWSRDVARDGQ
jgi:hypothetical protein